MGETNQDNKGMIENITALCYINGRMIIGSNGIEYDGHPTKGIIIKHGMTFAELEKKLCKVFKIDRSQCNMKIVYRYPQVMQHTIFKYEPVPVSDDEDIEIIFNILSRVPSIFGAELYLEVQPIEEQEAYVNIHEPFGTTSQPRQRSITPRAHDTDGSPLSGLATTSAAVVGGGYTPEGLPSHINDNSDITTDTDTGIGMFSREEKEYSGEEPKDNATEVGTSCGLSASDMPKIEPPSTTFTQLDWSVADASISQDLVAQSCRWDKNMELHKGMRFTEKKELQSAVKQYSIMRHQQCKVIESTPKLWVVKCKKNYSGCNWMLRAVQRKTHGQFEITQYVAPHTCVYSMLSHDRSELDSSTIAGTCRPEQAP